MTYRLPDKWSMIIDRASKNVIVVDNGTISRIVIPCAYGPTHFPPPWHDKAAHDHMGWPTPDSPDQSCQIPVETISDSPDEHQGEMFVVNEIDFAAEGYDEIAVAFTNPPAGLDASGYIDYNLVRVTITTMCEGAVQDDLDVPFSVYAIGSNTDSETGETIQLRDVITKGMLHIIAGPLPTL